MKKNRLLLIMLVLFAVILLTFTACNKVAEILIDESSNIRYDGQILSWDKGNADYTMLSINGGDEVRVNASTYSLNASSDSFEVTLTAILEDARGKSVTKSFRRLPTIASLYTTDNGVVYWDAVVGANAYAVSVNGQIDIVSDTTYDKFTAGNHRIKVMPCVSGDDNYWSSYSEETVVNVLATPSNVKYDGTTLTWSGNATTYSVTINGEANQVSSTMYAFNSGNRDFELSIKAIGNHTSTYDSAVKNDSFHYLDTATNLVVENGTLTWDAVNDAEGYIIKVNNVEKARVTTNSYDGLVAGTSQAVKILPYNTTGNYFSSLSAEKNVFILSTPATTWNSDLDPDGVALNNLTWNAVNAAAGYTVSVTKDGKTNTFNASVDSRAFEYAFSDVGIYTVKVKANADPINADYSDSKYSAIITVERLAAPTAANTNYIVSDANSLASGFTVTYNGVNGAQGYQLYKDGALVNGKYATGYSISDTNVADVAITTEQHYTYSIRSIGNVRSVNGGTYVRLSCLSSDALSFDITVQAMPTDLSMSGFSASWTNVAGNNGYAVSTGGTVMTAQTESMDLSTLNTGTYDIGVCTRGNGTTTLASNYCATLNVQRLAAPTNIKIVGGEGNGRLAYDEISNASGYSVYLDHSTQALDETAYTNMYNYITTSGTVLSMVANANKYNTQRTIYYMDSPSSATIQFIRLATPTFPEGALSNNTELVWNAPSNINTAEYTPTYTVYESDVAYNGQQNGTKYALSSLDGGKSYTFTIKAVGNATKYLDSEQSLQITFYKLAMPQITVSSAGYSWNGVTNSSSYYLEIDGNRVNDAPHVSGNVYTHMPLYTTIGTHTVKLYAIGDGRTTVNSNNYTYNQQVEISQAPVISSTYSADSFVVGGRISANITTTSPNAIEYQYEIAGKTITSEALSASQVIENAGTFTIQVKALGGVFDANDVYYVDSQYSAVQQIIILAAPSNSTFVINSDGVISWSGVNNSNGYDYQISYNNGEYSTSLHRGYAALEPISNFRTYTSISVKVRASSNGAAGKVNSEWTTWTWSNNQ